jgi:hypothetical protein
MAAMNKYGERAREHWKTHRPQEYATIPDPEEFFAQIGQEAERQIGQLQMKLAAEAAQPETTYPERVGLLNMAKLRAEEAVMAELLPPPENETGSEADEDDPEDETGTAGTASIGPDEIIGPGHPLFEEIDQEHQRLNRDR